MAKSATNLYLWEPDYDKKWKSSVIENEDLFNTLVKNTPEIQKRVDLCDKFWSLLLQRGVVDEDTKTRIQGYKQKHAQVASLVQHVMSVELYKFHGFLWALVNSNQCHLAELFGFAVRDYLDVEVFLMSSAFQCPACKEFYTKAYILTGCGHYVCAPCVKGAQFIHKDNKKEDVTCPIPECGKISEASPKDGNIGLEEDGDFNNLCEAVLKKVKKQPGRRSKGKSNTSRKDKLSQQLQKEIKESCLEKKISCLQKYRDILGKSEPAVRDYIVGTVEKVKQDVDDWAKETLGLYSNVCQQVEKNLHKSIKWRNVASELSVLMTATPEFLEGCLKVKVDLPKETVTDAGEKVITQLDSGCSIPVQFPYVGCGEMSFSYTVKSISKLMNTQLSPPCMVRNLAWRISVQPHYDHPTDKQKEKSLAVFLNAEAGSESVSWSYNVTAELRLLSWKKDGRPLTRKVKQLYCNESKGWGYNSFLLWNVLMEPIYGYVKDDSIRLEVHIVAEHLAWLEKDGGEHVNKKRKLSIPT